MDYSEKWGTDVEEAVRLALIDLKLEKDQVEITILEEPSRGFLGLGAKLAKVRVEKKGTKPISKPLSKKAETAKKPREDYPKAKAQKEPKREKKRKPPAPANKIDKGSRITTDIVSEPEENLVSLEEHVTIDFLKAMTEKMGLALSVTARQGEEGIYIDIKGKDSGTVIGKRGQTLDAVQYLTSLVANKGQTKYVQVIVDAEHYRVKRRRTLEELADRLAAKVVKTKRSVRLEPMTPYERKVIHATLQKNGRVVTKSEGVEPYRRVTIELK